MERNLSMIDRVLRFALAFWWLGPWAPVYGSGVNWLLLIVGWIALVESFLGYCWIHKMLGMKGR